MTAPRSRKRRSGPKRRSPASGPQPPRRSGGGRRLFAWGILLLLLGGGLWGALLVWGFLPASPPDLAPRRVRIEAEDRRAAVRALADAGLVDAPGLMLAYVTFAQPLSPLVAREHWLGGGRTPRQLLALLSERSGEVATVALPEGRTSFELAERLERAGVCSGEGFLAAARDAALLGEFGVPGESAEGYLFPETYELRLDERPERVVRRFLREAQKRQRALFARFSLLDEHRALGLGEREVVILASLVERETGHADERARIARVFLNRLAAPRGETGGRLESDPTALYGCRALGPAAPPTCSPDGLATPALLKDERNPYSTYRHVGLPPGPIGNPGEAALLAVLRPAAGDDLYFVADGAGKHHFSRTFAEHRQSVERLKALRRGSRSQ